MRWIKLNLINDGGPVYVNMENCTVVMGITGSGITDVHGNATSVVETPAQIFEALEIPVLVIP